RSGASTKAGEARPFAHSALPVGCAGSGSIANSRPSSTTATQPQREAQSGQNAGTRRLVLWDIDSSTLRSCWHSAEPDHGAELKITWLQTIAQSSRSGW